jgi:WD40 repeat protein
MVRGPIDLIGHTNVVMATAFTSDGQRLVSGGWDNTIKVWSVERASEEATLRGHTNWISSLATSSNGRYLASGSGDFTVKLWDLASLAEIKTFRGHTASVNSVALSADGTVLVSASSDHTARIWDPKSETEIARLDHPYEVRCLALTRDGALLVTTCDLAPIGSPPVTYLTFWDVHTRRQIGSVSGTVIRDSLAFTPDGTVLAAGYSDGEPPYVRGMVELWDVASHRRQTSWHAHAINVSSLTFTGDARQLATGSFDLNVRLWSVHDQRLVIALPDQHYWVNSVAITSDGWWLASGGGRAVLPTVAELHLWDLSRQGG